MTTYCLRRFLLSKITHVANTSRQCLPLCAHARSQSSQTGSEVRGGYRLRGRGVVRVAGRDTFDLLQGLVTSDVTELTDTPAQYSMMLNVQGRVLYDLILYNQTQPLESVSLLVECDAALKDEFIKAVRRYRIRKKVDISDVSSEYSVWSVPSKLDPSKPLSSCEQQVGEVNKALVSVPDPRVPVFGQRVLFRTGEASLVDQSESGESYEALRYLWGIPEGSGDLPPGSCLPLESNLTIMNGVSFLKGCYIGQELTARTHHTGVIRKRLMPLLFDREPGPVWEEGGAIRTDQGRSAGKVRGVSGRRGLGLVRLEHRDKPLSLAAPDGSTLSLTTFRPAWWPQDLLQ